MPAAGDAQAKAPAAASEASSAAPRTSPRTIGAFFSEDAMRKYYPPQALRMGMEGLVVLDVQVGADGQALAVRLRRSSGYDLLDETALRMAREARYTAATVDSRPVTDWIDGLRIRFTLGN